MTISESFSLFCIMLALAALPSASVALVVTRSATMGICDGIAVALGIVLGDLVFVVLAILGLSAVAQAMGGVFMVIKYLGACYLIYLGFSLWRGKGDQRSYSQAKRTKGGLLKSFLAGFILTLGDIKAIFFYASLLPLFLDLSALRADALLTVMLITITTVGGVKVAYALLAIKIKTVSENNRYSRLVRKSGGAVLMGAGSYLIVKT